MPSPIKICREPWSKPIQHLPAIKSITKAANRKFRHQTKQALKRGAEPPTTITGGDRY